MVHGCLVDEMESTRWRVQYEDNRPTPAQHRLGIRNRGVHQRTFKTKIEALNFAKAFPLQPYISTAQLLEDRIFGPRHKGGPRKRRAPKPVPKDAHLKLTKPTLD
jgi:hypothetical protein